MQWPPSTLHLVYACEPDIFKTVSPINFTLEICFHNVQRTDAIDFGPSAENKMAAIKIIKMYVNAISLQWFHQSTSSLIYEVISPKG